MTSIERIARREGTSPARLKQAVASGRVVLVRSRHRRRIEPLAIGEGTRVKVNANIGTSPDRSDVAQELTKLRAAVRAGADAVMDLSVGGDVDEIRRAIIGESPVAVGTVPIYQVALDARGRRRSWLHVRPREVLAGVEKHLADGVDFVTVHCGVTRRNIEALRAGGRVCGIVSRGGAMMAEWMKFNRRENPLYEFYDELLAMAKDHRAVLSIGDGLRPGALADATDEPQVGELLTIGELVERARAAGVQAMVEGPGHVPLDQIEANVRLEKEVCAGAPFYLLGPLVTDIAAGHDHIAGAIGGALAAWFGADFLCYVTPAEHLGLPGVEDVRQGVIASRIAGHAADVARGNPAAVRRDLRMSKARAALNWPKMWKEAIDPERARAVFEAHRSRTDGVCTMCGEFCAIKKTKETFDE